MLVLVYIIATIAFFPGSILTIGAGYVFYRVFDENIGIALLVGTICVWLGA